MLAKQQLQKRHSEAYLKLHKVANPKIKKKGLVVCCTLVATELGVSSQTVINYIGSRGKDGYLTEAITQQFRKV